MRESYTTRAEITPAEIPLREVVRALDDNKDGDEDEGLFDQICSNAADDIDGILGQRYTVPFTAPIPPIVLRASRLIILDKLYARRQVPNPRLKDLDDVLLKLSKIAAGEESLAPAVTKAAGSVSIITEDSRVHSTQGGIL